MTNKQLAWLGVAVGAAGLVYELYFSPKAQAQIAAAKAAGKPLGPLGTRPLTSATTAPIVPAKASTATPYTSGNPSGLATRPTTTSSGFSLGSALGAFGSLVGNLFQNKPDSKSGGGGFSAAGGLGGAPSQGGTGSGAKQFSGSGFDAGNVVAGGAGPTQSSAYVDGNGFVAYPNGDGTYSDENGNQVYITADGSISYDSTQDVGYVAGGEVFPNSYDPNDPSTYDFGVPASIAALDPNDPNGDGSYLGDSADAYAAGVPDAGIDPGAYDASDAAGIATNDIDPNAVDYEAGGFIDGTDYLGTDDGF